jgi:hypothetical protein
MRTLGRFTLCFGAAAALLAGCGGSKPPIGPPGAIPQSHAIATHAQRGGSWMLPEAKGANLLYASDAKNRAVIVYSYPDGNLVGHLSGFPAEPASLCSDRAGNVYVTTQGDGTGFSRSYVYEYAHAGTEPITTLSDPGYAYGCATDSVTGNLAVTNLAAAGGGNIAVYQNAAGTPTTYSDPNFPGFVFCTYDNSGNLFADGGPENVVDMLPKSGGSLAEIQLSKSINSGSIQWAHKGLAVVTVDGTAHGNEAMYNVRVSGGIGTARGPTNLISSKGTRAVGTVQFWIQGHTTIGPGHKPPGINGILEFWNYPKGGVATKAIKPSNGRGFIGVTISVAPRHKSSE